MCKCEERKANLEGLYEKHPDALNGFYDDLKRYNLREELDVVEVRKLCDTLFDAIYALEKVGITKSMQSSLMIDFQSMVCWIFADTPKAGEA